MTRFRTLRGRLTAVGVIVAVMAIAVLTIAFNLILETRLESDADSRLRTQAAAAATTVTYSGGRLHLRESPGDGAVDRVWVYDGARAIERPAGDRTLQRTADGLAGSAKAFDDVPGRDFRLYAAPIKDRTGHQVGTVVTGLSLAAYDRTTDVALLSSVVLGVLLAAAVFVLTWATIGRALAPVGEMTRSAAAWSESEPGRRFGAVDRPDELGELARTFDALLDRVAASLRHEQRLSAELSHELRTPLSRIVAETELLQRRDRSPEARSDAYDSIARSAAQMSTILETLMAAARAEAGLDQGRSDLRTALADLRRAWQPVMAQRGVTLEVRGPGAAMMTGVDTEVVQRIVAPLLHNAGRFATSKVLVDARADNGAVVVTIDDDGPGVPPEARETVFEPGSRLGPGRGDGGAGLGLPLARRLARAANGDVVATAPEGGVGARFRVELPR